MAVAEDSEEILYEVRDSIGWVTFNRPQARNALTFGMYRRLAEICKDAPERDALKAIVLCGAGEKAFAAGTDIAQFRNFSTAQDALDYEQQMDDVLGAVERCSVPTIAAIHGACTGGGAGIAAACDLRIAAQDFRFGFPIARTLGNCLSVENLSRLAALIGAGRTREIIFTARLVGAEEAHSIGLISETLEDRDAVMARAEELAVLMSGFAPLTLRATKEGLRRLRARQADLDDHDLVTLCYTSEDFKEGLEAFLAKRKPDWKGR